MATVQPKKRKGPAPTGKGTPIQVRLQPEQLADVDAWREAQSDKPSRPEALRRLAALAVNDRRQATDRREAVRLGGRRAGEE